MTPATKLSIPGTSGRSCALVGSGLRHVNFGGLSWNLQIKTQEASYPA